MTLETYFNVHLVSDSTGETLLTVGRAAASRYEDVHPIEHVYPMVRSARHLDHVQQRLYALSLSIAAGTAQIQRNIVGERMLGLPKER